MTINRKAAGHGDAPTADKITSVRDHSWIYCLAKAAVVWLAIHRVFPRRAAAWLIQHGGLRDA